VPSFKHVSFKYRNKEDYKGSKIITACLLLPYFYWQYGQHKGRDYLVMDLLGGEDMSKLRNRAREASGINLVTLPAAVYLAQEMLTCIESMHKMGFIHRDIKPANFVRRERESTKFAMIDFGLAKQVNAANRSALIPILSQ
jgi:serine/threonine protein kinase